MTRFARVLLLLTAATLLVSFGCSDDPPEVISEWSAILIEGALDPDSVLHENVDSSWSKIVFRDNGTYTWFLDAPPWFDLSGEGTYTAVPDSGLIRIGSGPILAYLGVTRMDQQAGSDTLTFLDDDSDRWTYVLTIMFPPN